MLLPMGRVLCLSGKKYLLRVALFVESQKLTYEVAYVLIRT